MRPQISKQQRATPSETREAEHRADRTVSSSARQFYPLTPPPLYLGAPDHPVEREADRVAEQVTQHLSNGGESDARGFNDGPERIAVNSHTNISSVPTIRRHMPGGSIADSGSSEGAAINGDVQARLSAERGRGGFSPPSELQTFFGRTLGRQAGAARLHHNDASDRLSRDFNADAFSLGGDVFFRRGVYDPHTPRGKHLLAHELTHVAQDGGQGNVVRRMLRGSRQARFVSWAAGAYKHPKHSGGFEEDRLLNADGELGEFARHPAREARIFKGWHRDQYQGARGQHFTVRAFDESGKYVATHHHYEDGSVWTKRKGQKKIVQTGR